MLKTFAEFVIDTQAAELRCAGQLIKVEPQVFDLIVFLASNPGRVLTKGDLVQGVWHGRAISDSAISTRINAARRALGDDGATQRFIKTVHGRGFRFDGQPKAVEVTTVVTRTHNLPTPATTFIGRDQELTSVKALLGRSDVRMVSLTGVGGVGKTRIAQKVAVDVAPLFRDGVWFVDLAPLRDASLVGSTIARTLRVQEANDQPLLDRLRAYLGTRNALLVLDNFEHVLPAANLVADLLATCPSLRILATSRATLRLAGEREFRVPPLTLPTLDHVALGGIGDEREPSEAERLFMARAPEVEEGLTSTKETRLAVAEICLRLDGIPLAIELAAARVRLLTPTELLQRLTKRLPVLSAGPRDLPARQQTLRKTIDWSHDLLEVPEQKLFHQLSVFVGGFTTEAAEAVADDLHGIDVLDSLGRLLNQSLIQRNDVAGRARFSMLETLREFAAEKLAEDSDASRVRVRHVHVYRDLAEEGEAHIRGPRQEAWLAQLAREHDNMRAALTWAFKDGGDVELGSQLVGTLWWFWAVRGHFSEGRGWAALAMQSPDTLSAPTRAGLLRAQANFAFLQGDYAHARPLAAEAAVTYRQLGRPVDAVWLQGLEAIAVQYLGDLTLARRLLEDALRGARPLNDAWTSAWMLRNLGRIAHDTENDDEAVERLDESLELTRRIGDVRGIALSLHYLGVIALDRNADQSGRYLAECVELFRQIDDRRGLAWALHYLAAATVALGLSGDALRFETESLSLRRDLGDQRGIAECLEGHASRMTLDGQAEPAIRLFATAAAMRKMLGTPGSPADLQRVQKHLEMARAASMPEIATEAWRMGSAATVDAAVAWIGQASIHRA
jgi:predicted ATPase